MSPAKTLLSAPLLLISLLISSVCSAGNVSHRLALGGSYGGWQVHWGFAPKWALEARGLKGKETSSEGSIKASVYGLRAYRYLRAPNRVRFYLGIEGAATRSTSSATNYKTSGFAAGGFGGSEIYLMKRLAIGVDVGPYMLSSSVHGSNSDNSEVFIVVNSYLNFYFL